MPKPKLKFEEKMLLFFYFVLICTGFVFGISTIIQSYRMVKTQGTVLKGNCVLYKSKNICNAEVEITVDNVKYTKTVSTDKQYTKDDTIEVYYDKNTPSVIYRYNDKWVGYVIILAFIILPPILFIFMSSGALIII
jgi:hypothetical protein